MKITAVQNIRKYTVVATTKPRQYKVVVSSAPKQTTITVAPLGKRGFRGYSAYELAVQKGFVGTEPEWLESLKGENFQETFETVSKNLKSSNGISSNVSDKTNMTFSYANGITKNVQTTESEVIITLSGSIPDGIANRKVVNKTTLLTTYSTI